jgi:DNA/RNA-binding domain of Phe-tRNA-synthetase-like protein
VLTVDPHPLLDLRVFISRFPQSLGELPVPAEVLALLSAQADAPLKTGDVVREAVRAVRQLLRQGGFQPTGRSKPASEYLLRAAAEGRLGSINLAVDVANVVSLHSGLPISVVDLAAANPPLRVGIAQAGESYVFNTAGQVIELQGLVCLRDADGPCANAVKDAQRTKTGPGTCETLSLVWGTHVLAGRASETEAWYRELLEQHGATTEAMSAGK